MIINSGVIVSGQNFTLPPLPYSYDALEPHVAASIMKLHHDKHHRAYITNLNNALVKQLDAAVANDFKEQIKLQSVIKFNGGGHINHSLFWKNLAPANSTEAQGGPGIKKKITEQWGTFEDFQKEFSTELLGIQGSGWAWLAQQPNGYLKIVTTKDQDPVLDATPLLGVDIWEHAYYLQYMNDKASYVKNIMNVINWDEVQRRSEQNTTAFNLL